MRLPEQSPDVSRIAITPDAFQQVQRFFADAVLKEKPRLGYLHWDKLRRIPAPPGLSHEEWWAVIKLSRLRGLKPFPLQDKNGRPFYFSMPDPVTEQLHEIDMGAGGKIAMPEAIPNTQVRDQYIVSSL